MSGGKLEKAIIGAGGFAREVRASLNLPNIKFFVDEEYEKIEENIYGLSKFDPSKYEVIIAIGDPIDRANMVNKLPKNTHYFTFIDSSVQILDKNIEIGEGSIICAGSIITTNIRLGKHTHLNLLTTIVHDVTSGDYLTTAPGAKISGNVNIKDCVYIGTNASIKEKLKIHNNVIIGSNAAVVKDINTSGVYVGVPTKKIK